MELALVAHNFYLTKVTKNMMRNVTDIAVALVLLAATVSGFTAPAQRMNRPTSSLSMVADVPPIVTSASTSATAPVVSGTSAQLQNGIDMWSASSSSVVLSEESSEDIVAKIAAKSAAANEAARVKAEKSKKSAEQLAEEKKTFAWYFWGGGFVAPFLATFYYFGFKFWEK